MPEKNYKRYNVQRVISMFCCSYSLEEVRKRLDKMGLKKARGPDDLPMEAIRIDGGY